MTTRMILTALVFIVFVPLEFLPRLFGNLQPSLQFKKKALLIGKRGANSRFAPTTRDSFNLTISL
jgi:hypothetical protein